MGEDENVGSTLSGNCVEKPALELKPQDSQVCVLPQAMLTLSSSCSESQVPGERRGWGAGCARTPSAGRKPRADSPRHSQGKEFVSAQLIFLGNSGFQASHPLSATGRRSPSTHPRSPPQRPFLSHGQQEAWTGSTAANSEKGQELKGSAVWEGSSHEGIFSQQ